MELNEFNSDLMKKWILTLAILALIVTISGCTSNDGNASNQSYTNTTTQTPTQATTAPTTSDNSSSESVNTTSTSQHSTGSGNYIGNSNTGKFHLASCRYVSKMNDENKVFFNSRESAIASGYQPCKVCNP